MSANGAAKLIEVRDLEMHFPLRQGIILQKQVGAVRAVDGIRSTSSRARRSGSWASRAAASRPPRAC